MSNISREQTVLKCVRNAGMKDFNTNTVYGGNYYPAHVNAKGQQVAARYESNFFINHKSFTDAGGNAVEAKPDIIRVTAWNSKEGGGQADNFARAMSQGIEACFDCHLGTYEGEYWTDNGIVGGPRTRVNMANGQPLMIPKVGFTIIPNSLIIGVESSKLVLAEIQTGRRLPNWNNPAHPDHQSFRAANLAKNAEQYVPGGATFGYSKVIMTGSTGSAYPATPVINPAMVAAILSPPGTAPVLVEGFDLPAWRATAITDDQMLSSVKFQPFHQMISAERAVGGGPALTPGAPTTVVNGGAAANAGMAF